MSRIPGGLVSWTLLVTMTSACASVPPAAPVPATPAAPVVPIERKAAWILRLEQQRTLSDPAAGADLVALARDGDTGVRRRATLALGRAGVPAARPALEAALADSDEAVRATGAFALGLLGVAAAQPALEAALKDSSPLVRGRAAQALGLLGATSSASAIADTAAACPALMAPIPPDDEDLKAPDVELCRLSLVALVRLRQFDAISRLTIDPSGAPVSRWWPVAFALQRSGDPRAADALAALATGPGIYTPAFAVRGLAGLKDARAVPLAIALATRPDADVRLRAEAIRAIGRLGAGARAAVAPLLAIAADRATPEPLLLDTIAALGESRDARPFDAMLDLFSARSPAVRAAAMAAAARMDAEGFLLALSSFERDPEWSVRANLATILGELPPDRAAAALDQLIQDPDVRVQGPALRALVRIGADGVDSRLIAALQAPDFVVRATAASLVGERRPAGGAAALAAAYTRGESDATYVARTAALDALARYPPAESRETLTRALGDREWAVRLSAARLLAQAGVPDAAPVRPAPLRQDQGFFESDRLLRPTVTPHVLIETRLGTIQLELNMIEAPLTSLTFVELARAGFFNGVKVHRLIPNFVIQAGDPRGDGEGGPGYAIRDELSPLPFVRGTVGMAIDGRDTAGSQFFIALSPQPHLDGQYTVFGRVIAGWEILDRVALWDVIERVTIWDGAVR